MNISLRIKKKKSTIEYTWYSVPISNYAFRVNTLVIVSVVVVVAVLFFFFFFFLLLGFCYAVETLLSQYSGKKTKMLGFLTLMQSTYLSSSILFFLFHNDNLEWSKSDNLSFDQSLHAAIFHINKQHAEVLPKNPSSYHIVPAKRGSHFIFFVFLHENIMLWYSLEAPQ